MSGNRKPRWTAALALSFVCLLSLNAYTTNPVLTTSLLHLISPSGAPNGSTASNVHRVPVFVDTAYAQNSSSREGAGVAVNSALGRVPLLGEFLASAYDSVVLVGSYVYGFLAWIWRSFTPTVSPLAPADSLGSVQFSAHSCNVGWQVFLEGESTAPTGGCSPSGYTSVTYADLPNGTYHYYVASTSAYWVASPAVGTVNVVEGSLVSVSVAFVWSPGSTVMFNATSPSCIGWEVNLDGEEEDGHAGCGNPSLITFSNIPNGTYYYAIASDTNGWIPSRSWGALGVSGSSNVTTSVTFAQSGCVFNCPSLNGTSNLTFTEHGLPPSGAGGGGIEEWGVSVGGVTTYTDNEAITFQHVATGNYSFTMLYEEYSISANGLGLLNPLSPNLPFPYLPSPLSSVVDVSGPRANVSVGFHKLGNITVSETGLPFNPNLTVIVAGRAFYLGEIQQHCGCVMIYNVPANATLQYFTYNPCCSYDPYYKPPSGFLATSPQSAYLPPEPGTVHTNSTGDGAISLVFSKIPDATFHALDVPTGATWGVDLDGQSQSTTSSSLTFFNVPTDNSFLYSVVPPQGFFSLPSSGTMGIGTANVSRLILFTNSSVVTSEAGNATLVVHVVDNTGNPVSGVYVTFFDENQNPLGALKSGPDGFTAPVQLPNTVIVGAYVGNLPYYTPTPELVELASGQTSTVALKITHLPEGQLTGRVSFTNGTGIVGALVTASQSIGGVSLTETAQTNGVGNYSMALPSGPTTVRAAETDFFSNADSIIVPTNGTATLNLTMNELSKADVYVYVYTRFLNQTQFYPFVYGYATSHAGLDPRITDVFGNQYDVSQTPLQIAAFVGETIQACWDGSRFGLPSECNSTLVNSTLGAAVSIFAAQQGLVRATIVAGSSVSPVSSWSANVYIMNSSGYKEFVTSIANLSSVLDYSPPGPGTYEFDVQSNGGQSNSLYGSFTVPVNQARIVEVGDVSLTSGQYFTGRDGNGVLSIPRQASPGTSVTIRAAYDNTGGQTLSNAALLLEIPAQTSLEAGSISLNGKQVTNPTHGGAYYSVPLGDLPAGASGTAYYTIQLSANFSSEALTPSVLVNYTMSSRNYQELIGTANVQVYQLTISAPSSISSLATVVSGQGLPESQVTVYDGTIVLGGAVVPQGGYWGANVTLPSMGNSSVYILHAQASTPSGGTYDSQSIQVSYTRSQVELTQICMSQPDGRDVCFNPANGVAEFPYVIETGEPLNFELYFSNSSQISGVQVGLGSGVSGNATLGLDGIYRVTFQPSDTNSWNGLLYVNYVRLATPITLPTTQEIKNIVSSIEQNSKVTLVDSRINNITGTKETEASFNSTIAFPNGTPGISNGTELISATSINFTRDVSYTPNSNDANSFSSSGYPLFNFSSMVLVNTSGSLEFRTSFFVPYSAFQPTLVHLLDKPSEYLLPGAGVAITIIKEIKAACTFLRKGIPEVGGCKALPVIGNVLSLLGLLMDSDWLSETLDSLQQCRSEMPAYLQAPGEAPPPELSSAIAQFNNIQSRIEDTGWWIVAGDILGMVPLGFEWELIYGIAGLAVPHDQHVIENRLARFEQANCPNTYNHYAKVDLLRDPSGIVYSGLLANTLSNVTASVFYKDPDTAQWILWDASAYGQQNNQLTDLRGRYGWEVPQGLWMVVFQKPGYRTAQSAVFNVPPPATGVDADMIPTAPPSVVGVSGVSNVTDSFVEAEFNQYMKASDLNGSSITVSLNGQSIRGTVTPVDPQPAPNGVLLAREAIFTPSSSSSLVAGNSYSVNVGNSVANFANVTMSAGFSTLVKIQSSLSYSESTSTSTVAVGGSANGIATTTDPLATVVRFSWYSPDGTLISTVEKSVTNGEAQSPTSFPAQAGTWKLQVNFTDGVNVLHTSTSTFNVVQPLPFSLVAMQTSLNATGGFVVNTESSNGLTVQVSGSHSPAGTPEGVTSFIYASTPPGVFNVQAQTGATPIEFVNVGLYNSSIGGTAQVCASNNALNSSSSMYVYDHVANAWSKITMTASQGTVCGDLPVSSLSSATLVLAAGKSSSIQTTTTVSSTPQSLTSSSTTSTSSSSSTSPASSSGFPATYALAGVVVALVVLVMVAIMLRRRGGGQPSAPLPAPSGGVQAGAGFCPHCGHPVSPQAAFCNECGNKLS